MNINDLEKTVKGHAQRIRAIVQGCSTESVVRNCLVRSMKDYLPFDELTSPAKQMYFLLGLSLGSQDPVNLRHDYKTEVCRIALVSTPINYTCTNLAEHLEGMSHDVVSDFLKRERLTAGHLWELVEEQIDDSPDAYLIIDDSVQDKRYSRSIEMVKLQYSGAAGGLVRGIAVVNLVHTGGEDGGYYPIDFRIYAKNDAMAGPNFTAH